MCVVYTSYLDGRVQSLIRVVEICRAVPQIIKTKFSQFGVGGSKEASRVHVNSASDMLYKTIIWISLHVQAIQDVDMPDRFPESGCIKVLVKCL